MSLSGLPETGTPSISGGGFIDFAGNRAEFTMNTALVGGGEVEREIFADGALYNTIPSEFRKHLGTKAKWMKTVIPKEVLQGNFFAGGLGFSGLADPSSLLTSLKSVSSSVTVVGHPRVRGIQTTEYFAVLDDKALASLDPSGSTATLGRQNVKVYIGSDGLVYRLEVVFSIDTSNVTGVLDFSDYGVPVHIQAPPASDVIDENEFSKLATASPFPCPTPTASSPPTASCGY